MKSFPALFMIFFMFLLTANCVPNNNSEENMPAQDEETSENRDNKASQGGVLGITTIPADAEVHVDGVLKGKTPFTYSLRPGAYTVSINKYPQYQEKTIEVQIQPGQTIARKYILDPLYVIVIPANPEGARIKIDGKFQRTTPATISWTKRTCRLRIEKRGWSTYDKELILEPGLNNIDYSLQSGTVLLSIRTTPSQAVVFLGDKELGKSPLKKSIAPGKHSFRIIKEGYNVVEETLSITSNINKHYTLVKGNPVFLRIAVAPWAEVYIDGRLIGEIPPVKKISIAAGKHTIKFKQMDKEFSYTLEIKANENKGVNMNMTNGDFREIIF